MMKDPAPLPRRRGPSGEETSCDSCLLLNVRHARRLRILRWMSSICSEAGGVLEVRFGLCAGAKRRRLHADIPPQEGTMNLSRRRSVIAAVASIAASCLFCACSTQVAPEAGSLRTGGVEPAAIAVETSN